MGTAEHRLGADRADPRPEHGRALRRSRSARRLARLRRDPRLFVGARDPLFHHRARRVAAVRARLVHAGLPRPLRAVARGRALPQAGGCHLHHRRALRDPLRLFGAPLSRGAGGGKTAAVGRVGLARSSNPRRGIRGGARRGQARGRALADRDRRRMGSARGRGSGDRPPVAEDVVARSRRARRCFGLRSRMEQCAEYFHRPIARAL